MIRVDEALQLIEQHAERRDSRRIPSAQAHGLVLDEEIVSSLDSPANDKSLVDGFAVRCQDVRTSGERLQVIEEVTAGLVPTRTLEAGMATRIMTGAPVPSGGDAVVMVERTEMVTGNSANEPVVLIHEPPRAGQNIMRRGEAIRAGDVVLKRGHILRAIEIGLLAELGCTEVVTICKPSVAIISTGNELVPDGQTPGPGQIRNSNGPMLESLVWESGGESLQLGIVPDSVADLTAAIERGLECDILILSGGVSAGVLDLVPKVLQQLGVQEIFHKVQLKPGKPLWFGAHHTGSRQNLVFGLPGNPVSSLVCFELFVRPAVAKMAGKPVPPIATEAAELSQPFRHRGDRPTFHPGRLVRDKNSSRVMVESLQWHGSADLRTLADADVLICFEPGDYELQAGECVRIRRL